MALLAAAALDRHPVVVRVLTVGATALLAVAFVPVFSSFAADNAGLVAAGRASSGSPGMLLTDSPVAAYYSGKKPSEITGSRVLPVDRAQALEWMRTHRVGTLVLEDISYYRATLVFPDLAHGSAAPPFATLGAEGRYQVSGGKTVYVYSFGAARTFESVYPGVDADITPMPAEGKTAALAKGVALRVDSTQVTGEGMGFGVPIVHYGDGWVYSRTVGDVDLATTSAVVWRRTFQLDEIGGDAAHRYEFVPIPSRGEIEVTYTIDSTGVSISVKPLWLAPGYSEGAVLNEQSAAFNDFAADRQPTLVDGAFGNWVPVSGSWARLRSGSLGVEWSVPSLSGAGLYGGRELTNPDFDWAGLDYVFPGAFTGTSYHINVKEAR